MFDFGRSYGLLLGVAAGLSIPVQTVLPQVWGRHYGLTGTGKDGARTMVQERLAIMAEMFRLKKHSDRADAVMIDLYGAVTVPDRPAR